MVNEHLICVNKGEVERDGDYLIGPQKKSFIPIWVIG